MDVEEPLLRNEVPNARRNSVTSMRCDFFSKLPRKVKTGLDPEEPFLLDLSKTTGLINGNASFKHCLSSFCLSLVLISMLLAS